MKKDDPRNKIIKYLRIKNKLSEGYLFKNADRLAILTWPEDIAQKVWKKLEKNILVDQAKSVCQYTCPFCIRYRSMKNQGGCKDCEWGMSHGVCKTDESDYHKYKNGKKFTNAFYKKAINEINEVKHGMV